MLLLHPERVQSFGRHAERMSAVPGIDTIQRIHELPVTFGRRNEQVSLDAFAWLKIGKNHHFFTLDTNACQLSFQDIKSCSK